VDVAEEAGSQSTIREQELAPKQATAFVSIMQGCNMHCTFCIVPQTRGSERSRTVDEIVSEVRDLVARGVKEVTLLGQIVNLYGRHEFPKIDNKSPFVQLLEAVHEVEVLKRLRFTSPHPIGFSDDLIDERTKEARNHDLLRIVNESTRRAGERLLGHCVEVLCEGPSKTNRTRLMGRTRTNKIVVFEGNENLIGELFHVRVQQANGFSLYGVPVQSSA